VTAPEIVAAIEALGDGRKAIQRGAAERLAEAIRATPVLRVVVAAELASVDPGRRWAAAYALAHVEPAAADVRAVLVEGLGSSDGDVRWASARLITRAMAYEPEIGLAIAGLLDSASGLQRKMALYCLRDAGPAAPGADEALLLRALGDVDAPVRLAALAAAVALLPRHAILAERIACLLDDPEPGVRRAAAATVGRLGVRTDALTRALERAACSTDAALARAAAQALSRLAASAPARP
jgi:hypothetical protein